VTWQCPRCQTVNEKPRLIERFQYGCTGISWLFEEKLPGHECCEEHDVAYNQGGTLRWKATMDAKLARCIFSKNGKGIVGALKSAGAWLAVTFLPYPYIVWRRPEQ
jgi:hypothetical protein